MFKYFQIAGVIFLILILVMITAFASKSIVKNDMTAGDNFFDFLDYFKAEYEGLYTIWNVIIGILVIAALYFITLMI